MHNKFSLGQSHDFWRAYNLFVAQVASFVSEWSKGAIIFTNKQQLFFTSYALSLCEIKVLGRREVKISTVCKWPEFNVV